MFSCLSSSDVIIPASRNGDSQLERILDEGIKLKRKCNSLNSMLRETESRRNEEKLEFQKTLTIQKSALESEINQMKAQHYIELSQMRDYRIIEINQLSSQLNTLKILLQRKEEELEIFRKRHEYDPKLIDEEKSKDCSAEILEGLIEENKQHIAQLSRHYENKIAGLSEKITLLEMKNLEFRQQNEYLELEIKRVSSLKIKQELELNEKFLISKIQGLSEELNTAHSKISVLEASIIELVRSKEEVEKCVKEVLDDNISLTEVISELEKKVQMQS